jgi:ribosomal protein S13
VDSIEKLKGMRKGTGLGPKTLEKIEEILQTGGLARLENFKSNARLTALTKLTTVWGIGQSTAEALIDKEGIYTINELKERIRKDKEEGRKICVVNDIVVKTVEVHDDLIAKIPRVEIEALREKVFPVAGNKKIVCMHVHVCFFCYI